MSAWTWPAPARAPDKLKDALVKAAEAGAKKVLVRRTGCMGPCSHGPLVRVDPRTRRSTGA